MAQVNRRMVEKAAGLIVSLPQKAMQALDFTEPDKFPAVGSPGALHYFFAVTMQDFGFWLGDAGGYVEPICGEIDGKKLKGSDLLWTLSMKAYRERGHEFFYPANLAQLGYDEFVAVWLPEKYGFQDMLARWQMAVGYGQYIIKSWPTFPADLTGTLNFGSGNLEMFSALTGLMPGYDRDPLMKKNLLLAMILTGRPEKFFKTGNDTFWPPIVDYHLMRVALRMGLVDLEPEEYDRLSSRVWVSGDVEKNIRQAVFTAVGELIDLTGKPMNEIDFLLWSARRYCPEMTKPDCSKCVFDRVCRKKTELFQPIFRTTNY